MIAFKPQFKGFAAANLILPDGTEALEGSGIAGTFYVSSVWNAG
ncbi:MAG: hypothetical protein RL547_2025 [Actinomycetota bacterium]